MPNSDDGPRDVYHRNYPLTTEARDTATLDPGNGSVSALCAEPRAFLSALTDMLAPFASSGRLTVLLEHVPIAAETDGDRIRAVTVRSSLAGDDCVLTAPYIIDATELGDLLELAKVEYVVGFESAAQTGDRSAPETAQPMNQQAFTICFPSNTARRRPHHRQAEAYTFWRDYFPTSLLAGSAPC